MREKKQFPEIFKYLGWCSWEEYKTNINEKMLVDCFKQLENCSVPVRFFLVDDGHFNKSTIKPDARKFPNGYKIIK